MGTLTLVGCLERHAPPELVTGLEVSLQREGCPSSMVRVDDADGGFCVDLYLAPGFGETPTLTNLEGAKAHCEEQGARLCNEAEWERACRGPSRHLYPYGDQYLPTACATGQEILHPVGMHNACRSGYGAYDMSGNVAEWTALGVLKGGDVRSDALSSRCGSRATAREEEPRYRGVRCCQDLLGGTSPAAN